MKGNCIIPIKNDRIDLSGSADFVLDTKGLCCRIRVVGGDIEVSSKNVSFIRYPLHNDEEFDFCGKLHLATVSGNPYVLCMYYKTV